jgi:hypothetical protein
MEEGTADTIVKAVTGTAATLAVVFRKLSPNQWQAVSNNRRVAIKLLLGLSLGMGIAFIAPGPHIWLYRALVILALLVAFTLFVSARPPQSN